MHTLSVIIISHNAASTLIPCLNSVCWANEIIIVDSHSTDETVEIAKNYTPHVYSMDWEGFGPQKNRALEKATQEWVLSLDTDEELSPELQTEIQELLQSDPPVSAYFIKRKSYFCTKLIQHGDWGRDKVLRLFKRGAGQFDNVPVHEKLVVNEESSILKNNLLHYTAPSINQVLEKMNRYSSLGAEKKVAQGKSSSLSKALLHGLWSFIRCYFIHLGFLDGRAGFILAVTVAEGTYYRYLKMLNSL